MLVAHHIPLSSVFQDNTSFWFEIDPQSSLFQVNANVRPVSKVVIVKSHANADDMELVAHIAAIVCTLNRKDAIRSLDSASVNLDIKVFFTQKRI